MGNGVASISMHDDAIVDNHVASNSTNANTNSNSNINTNNKNGKKGNGGDINSDSKSDSKQLEKGEGDMAVAVAAGKGEAPRTAPSTGATMKGLVAGTSAEVDHRTPPRTAVLHHPLCLKHFSCPPLKRSSDPPPENVKRLEVIYNEVCYEGIYIYIYYAYIHTYVIAAKHEFSSVHSLLWCSSV